MVAVAIQFVKSIGSAASSDAGITALSITVPASGVAKGNMLLARFAAWNYGGVGSPSVSDSKGNSWSIDFSRVSGNDGMNIVCSAIISTPLVSGDTVTVSFPSGNTDYAFAVDEFAGVHQTARLWQLDATGVSGPTATPSYTITPNANPPAATLHIAPLFFTGLSSDGYTPDGDTDGGAPWNELTYAFSLADSHAQAIRGAYKIPAPGQTGVTQTWNPVLGTSRSCLLTQLIYQGGAPVTAPADSPKGVRTGAPVSRLVVDVVRATDVPAGTRMGAPSSNLVPGPPGPTLLTDDVPAGVRTGVPVDSLAIGVIVATDVPGHAVTGSPRSASVAIGVTRTTDVPAGVRTGAPVDGPLAIGVTVNDVPRSSRTAAPRGVLAIGVTLGTDKPAGSRSGAPLGAIGNTVTNDVTSGARTAAPVDTLSGNGPRPKPPSTLTDALPNPNRPVVLVNADFTGGPPSRVTEKRISLNAPSRRNVVRKISTSRGRQYELDQVQAGTCNLEITDPLELLNPANTSSPFNTGGNAIKPYRRMRWVALFPTTGNIINELGYGRWDASTNYQAYDPSFVKGTGGWKPAGGTSTVTWVTTEYDSPYGVRVDQSAPGAGYGMVQGFDTAPGLSLVFSVYVYPDPGVSVQVQVTDGAGVVHTSNVASIENEWTRIYVTWRCVETLESIEIFGTGTATPRFRVDATQLEFGYVPTPFVKTGPVAYVLYSGYIERYPLTYDMQGSRGIRPLTAVDALAILSRTQVTETYDATIAADLPSVYLPLSNSAAPTTGRELGQGLNATPIYTITQNGSIQWGGDAHPDGTPAVVFSQQNAYNPPVVGGSNQNTLMDTTGGQISVDTANATIEFWARNTSGVVEVGGVGVFGPGENTVYPTEGNLNYINVHTNGGALCFAVYGEIIPATWPDGVWHYFAITLRNGAYDVRMDDRQLSYYHTPQGNLGMTTVAHTSAVTGFGDPQSQVSFGRWAFYTRDITDARKEAHYRRGIGYAGELSGVRVKRLLDKYWAGAYAVAEGKLAMAPDFDTNGRMILDVLQEIQESERGLTYADRLGQVCFEDRTSRYRMNNQQPLWTFGEDVEAGEYPYDDYAGDFDPTYTFSQANVTRPGNNAFPPQVNAATQADYGQRILSHTMQANSDFDLQEAAKFYLHRYATPKVRIEKLTLNPVANPALWPVVLSLEISQRVTVKRRAGGLVTSGDYYVEQVNHDVDADAGTWSVELQLSPVFVPQAWVLGDPAYGVLGTSTVPVY